MRRIFSVFVVSAIGLSNVGCQRATPPAVPAAASSSSVAEKTVEASETVAEPPAMAEVTKPVDQKVAAPEKTVVTAGTDNSFQPKTYVIPPSENVQFELQARLIEAVPGDTIQLEAGRYVLSRQLDVSTDNVTIAGRGPDKTILTFKGQSSSGQGLEVTGNNFTIENLAVEDTAGNAIKILGCRNLTMRGVRTEWTGEPTAANGAYGLYPVQCENVLMENCTAIGASDAGIYVGQCRNVIVRSCRAERNVAGIEIENTVNADVYDNVATNNAGGLLVFDMPGLQLKGGNQVRCYKNQVVANNHRNFADPGAIVAAVAPGTGVMVMATDNVEVFDNTIDQNQTVSVLVVSYTVVEQKVSDTTFDPVPEHTAIHDNRITKGGTNPGGPLGEALKPIFKSQFPDILWDGITKPGNDKLPLSIARNGDATFANFKFEQLNPENLIAGTYKPDTDSAQYAAAFEPLPQISLKPHDAPSAEGGRAAKVYRSVPKKLSEQKLFQEPLAKQIPVDGVLPYDLNTPLFSDYAEKHRFVRLPAGTKIEYRENGVFEFPVGALLVKTFSYYKDARDKSKGEQLLETRVEFRQADGWYGVTYVWNDEQTDASLVIGGGQVDVSWTKEDGNQQAVNYSIPNANQCLTCHSDQKAYVPIGPTARNLNRVGPGSAEGRKQLEQLAHAGLLKDLPIGTPIAAMPNFDDPHSGTTETRARAYLEVNCAHCHNPNGTARTTGLDLRADQTEPGKLGVFKNPVAAGHGSGGRKYDIVPGKPDESILAYRMESSDVSVAMPSVGRKLVHAEAVALVRDWIAGLKDPNAK